MHAQVLSKLMKLRAMVEKNVPNTASPDNIWNFLGWDDMAHKMYKIAQEQKGIDIRPIIAPVFSDVVSVVVDGLYMPKGHHWEEILEGQDPEFLGQNPKARMLSVFDTLLCNSLDA